MIKKTKEKLIDLNDEKQIKLVNTIFKDCNEKIARIIDLFEKFHWEEFIKEDEPDKFFYMLVISELYIYYDILRKTYNKDVCTNVIVTILKEYSKGFNKEPESFIEKALLDSIDMYKNIDNAVKKGANMYDAMFLYLISESCDVPYEIYTRPKEVLPLFVHMVFEDTAKDFQNLLDKIK